MSMKDYHYPTNWKEIATSIKVRAGWKCETCGIEHHTYIVREQGNPALWRYATEAEMTDEDYAFLRITYVFLTVHHIGVPRPDGSPGDMHDKMDCRPENLIALCQRCHLLADLDDHIARARQTRSAQKQALRQAAGQLELF